jgi:hypothetical protein
MPNRFVQKLSLKLEYLDKFFAKTLVLLLVTTIVTTQEPILQLLILQLQRQRCSRVKKIVLFSKRTMLFVAM